MLTSHSKELHMPMLPDARHEKIAQALARGAGIGNAYAEGGYKRNAVAASKFCAKPAIQARVAEIRTLRDKLALQHEIATSADIARKLGITKEKILSALWQNAERCLAGQLAVDEDGKEIPGKYALKPDAAGASRALQLLGMEAFSMFVERHEVGQPGDFARLTDDELAQKVTQDAEALGLSPQAVESFLAMFQGSGVKH
jgi:hypothetical protein